MYDGNLKTMSGRPALQFEQSLAHPLSRVWQAVSTPSELEQWFPAALSWEPATGELLEAFGMQGKILEVEEPTRLAWEFNGDFYSFDLTEQAAGTTLTFTYVFDADAPVAQTAAGWDTYLQKLEALLAGQPLSDKVAFANWDRPHEHYAAKFNVDPTPGRQFWEQLKESLDLKQE
ncbi:SRPBCC domain-containing protein [Yaniella halotolerans]|uniref:SRPBCC domain-containing protein n=1 Tax=Yaniella halotolerans TaxID=225453 RepID=UPI0003B3D4F4|nr:SRPBCC domain-containing protein [Yaniella halotolerans]